MREITERKKCPLCDGAKLKKNSTVKKADVMQCCSCGYLFSSIIDPEYIGSLYYSTADYSQKIQDWIDCNRNEWRELVEDIKPFVPARMNKILDVGAGSGGFLEVLREEYQDTVLYAIESSPNGRDNLKLRFPDIKFPVGSVDNIAALDDRFDMVSVLQCLEHVLNPLELLKKICDSLNDDGFAIITIPNCLSYEVRLKGKAKSHCFGNEAHLQYFSDNTFRHMAKRAGFTKIVRLSNFPLSDKSFAKKLMQYSLRKLAASTELRYILKR